MIVEIHKAEHHKGKQWESSQVIRAVRTESRALTRDAAVRPGALVFNYHQQFDLPQTCNWITAGISFPSTWGTGFLEKLCIRGHQCPLYHHHYQQQRDTTTISSLCLPRKYYAFSGNSYHKVAKSLKMVASFTSQPAWTRFCCCPVCQRIWT